MFYSHNLVDDMMNVQALQFLLKTQSIVIWLGCSVVIVSSNWISKYVSDKTMVPQGSESGLNQQQCAMPGAWTVLGILLFKFESELCTIISATNAVNE